MIRDIAGRLLFEQIQQKPICAIFRFYRKGDMHSTQVMGNVKKVSVIICMDTIFLGKIFPRTYPYEPESKRE